MKLVDHAHQFLSYLPSKNIILAIIFSMLVVGAGFTFSERSSPPTDTGSLKIAAAPPELKDDDVIIKTESIRAQEPPSGITPETIAEAPSFTGDLVREYVAAFQGGGASDETQEKAIARIAAEVARQNALRKKYTPADIVTSETETLKNYFDNVALVAQKYFPDDMTESEISVIAGAASQKEDPSTLPEKLQKYIYRYSQAAQELAKIKTPKDAVGLQTTFLNNFSNTALALAQISKFQTDPIIGVVGMKNYQDEIAASRRLFVEAKALAQKNQLTFSQNDPAYFFEQYFKQI